MARRSRKQPEAVEPPPAPVAEYQPGDQVVCPECGQHTGAYTTDGLHHDDPSHQPAIRFAAHVTKAHEPCTGSDSVHTLL